MNDFLAAIAALIPFVGGGALFYVVFKGVLEGDRRERAARERWAQEHPSGKTRNDSGEMPTEP